MQKILENIVKLDHVMGALFINPDGTIACCRFNSPPERPAQDFAWAGLLEQLNGIREADFTFSDAHIYLRRTENGCLVALIEPYAVMAMIRLQCDVFFSTLNTSKSRGLRRFFKK